jgi:hypothetical protein
MSGKGSSGKSGNGSDGGDDCDDYGAFTTCRFANIAEEDESIICNRQRKSIVVGCCM